MDAKDLRIGSALGERNDGSKYSQSGVALPTKSYQDNGCNPLGKAEVAAVRPCAVIGPDRVVPPPASDAYLKKASVDQWSCPDNLYTRLPEYPHKQLNNVNPSRNISPRQTFQENMQRIMVPPTYSAAKHADESILGQVQDRNAALSKNTKQTMAPEAKYCDVPYAVNLLNEHKNVRETEMCVPSVNSPLTRSAPSVWPSGGSNLHPRAYAAHDVYQYPQYPSCAGPRPSVMPMARPHRAFQEDSSYVYPDPYYQDAGVRYKPYQSVKERYPQARYEYINNYPNPFHPPPPYASHKYDIPNTRPTHPYSVYPHLKYLDNRILDPNIDVCQRPNQQSMHYNMQFRNQVIHPNYGSALGNPQNKLPSYSLDKSSNKLSLDNTKSYVDYENAKAKYALPDSYFVNEMPRAHQVQKPVAMPNYAPPGMHPSPLQQFHRKDNIPMKSFEYNMPHYRHFEHALGFNPSGHHPPQFSPSALAISPTDSNTSNDTTQTQGNSQEDCGYVSQSSTTSARSIDSNRLQNEYYRRYDYRYRPIIGSSHTLAKPDITPNKESKKIDVRQFLSMWSEGDEDNTNSNAKENSATNNYRRQESVRNQDQLYVLGLVNVPSEELAKYEHIQKVSKLPENIKGYNSIELLNQFEEVIESSNMNSFKHSTPKDFFPMKDRKNAIKQIVEVLPRPVSPLDVEAKISQSVIHKEVGCNFEIKPCSPKMLNVEIAAPVQNILGERSIEKVSNPLSNKAKSPLPTRIDGNTTCNNIQRQEGMHTSYENISCKMIGSPFAANNMESVKTDYSLHDLENSSGVCLASLPRLDNEIELNFPEVNQQFINANKGSRSLQDNYNREVKDDNIKLTTATDKNKTNNDSEKYLNVSIEDSGTKLSKLSKYRKTKVNTGCLEYPEDESKANAIRTDSVIIENPENVKKHEDNKEKISLHMAAVNEKENTPMNLTTQSVSHIESEFNTTNSQKPDKQTMDCALDFSFSKTENELSSLNVFDDELVNTSHKEMLMETITSHCNSGDHEKKNTIEISNKPSKLLSEYTSNKNNTNSIIVKNNLNLTCDYTKTLEEETSVLEAPKFDADSSGNDDKMNSDINFDKNQLNTGEKTNLTNVIVKHKHKNKSKISKSKNDIKKSNLPNELRNKNLQNLKKKNLNSSSASKNHESTNVGEKVKSKSVIQNNIYSEENNSIMEVAARDMCKNETGKTTFTCENDCASGNPTINISESHHCGDKINTVEDQSNLSSVNEDPIKNNTKTILAKIHDCKNVSKNLIENMVESANDVPIETDAKISRPIKIKDSAKNSESLIEDIVQEISDSTRLICDAEDFPGSYAGISQANKYYNDLISESELFVHKTYCIGVVNQSPSSSISHVETTSADSMNILVNSTVEHASNINTNDTTTDGMILNKSLVSESDLLQPKQCHTDNSDELNMDSLEDFDNSVGVGQLQCMEKEQSFNSKDACKNTSTTVTSLSDGIEVDKINVNTTVKNNIQQPSALTETMFIADKKLSIDSGYLSKKNSFEENNEEIIGFPSSSSEDSVFDEIESGTKSMAFDGFVEINNEKNDTLQPVFDSSISARTCEANYLILGNKTSEDSNNELEKQLTSKSNSTIEDLNTNMQIDKNDVLYPISDNLVSTGAGSTLLPEVETFEDANTKMNILPSTVLQSDVIFDNVDANMQILFAQPNEKVPLLNVDKIDDFNVVDKNVQLSTYNNLAIEFNMPHSKSELDKANSDNQTQLNKTKLNANEITKVDDVDEEEDKIKKRSSFDMLDKDKINDLSDSVKITDIVEPCIKSFNKDCNTKVDVCTHSKKSYEYCGKELYSPWIQKLIMYNEGKSNISDINGTKEIEQLNHNNEIISLEEPNNSVMKEATFEDAIYEINSENETENRDVNQKLNVQCENRSSETSSMIILNCSNDESSFSFDVISNQEKTVEINEDKSSISERKCESEFDDDDCIEESSAQNDLIDTNEISFSYPNNSIISQITENEFHTNENLLKLKFQDQNTGSQINQRRLLKRSFSDSALSTNINRNDYHTEGFEDLNNYSWPSKRNKIGEYVNYIPNNRRNSVNFEENVSFCILIDDNCIITEENEECISELQENFITEAENDGGDSESLNELDTSVHETNVHISNAVVLEYDEENPARDAWVEDITCVEDVFRDEVAENVVISAPSSPTDSTEEYQHDVSSIYENTTTCHTDEVSFLCNTRENIMSQDDSQMVDTLYKTHQMDKTLLYGDKNIESDSDPENILSESESWKPSPAHSPDYIDPTNASNDFRLETPENKENVFVKELSPLRRIDDYLDVSSAENETDEPIDTLPHHIAESDKLTQGSVYSCESSSYNLFDYKLKDQSADTTMPMPTSSSSPEVSSTTSEEKTSILLKITNLNGSRVSQVNEIELNNRPRCKFTEKKDYATSSLNFPNRPLITKAAQKYIPPIKESIRDLKVKISLPQQSLNKLKQLKLSRNEPKIHKQQSAISRITKKPKPNFDDVLKSIDEIQIKRHKEKSKKNKTVVPKVLIKKNENGSHYASTPKRDAFSPDLTGRKWQPWVYLEKNHFIDKMAVRNKTKAIFSHRKKTYVLAEKFKKYKSVSSAKFIITQPKTPGQLKYTIRLKHSF